MCTVARNMWKFWTRFQQNEAYSLLDSWFVWIAYVVIYMLITTEWQMCRKSHRNKNTNTQTHTHCLCTYTYVTELNLVLRLWNDCEPSRVCVACLNAHARTTPITISLLWISFFSNTSFTDSACKTPWDPASGTILMRRQSLQHICHWGHLCQNILLSWYCE